MPKAEKIGMTLSAFARKMGVTQPAVTQKIRRGRIPKECVYEDGSLNEELATKAWLENTDWNMKRGMKEGYKSASDHALEAERSGEYKIKLKQMEVDLETSQIRLERLKETTVDKGEAIAAARSLMRGFRDNMLNFPNRHGPALAAEFGLKPAEFVGALESRLREALNEFADAPNPFGVDSEDGNE